MPAPDGQATTPPRVDVDARKLEAYLIAHTSVPVMPAIAIRQFSLGQSNPTFLITDSHSTAAARNGGRRYVMRKKPEGGLVDATAHAVEREYRVMKALGGVAGGFPVPKMLALCSDATVIGTPFYIMTFVEGTIFPDASLPGLSSDDKRQCWNSAVDVLARLHTILPASIDLSDYGPSRDFYPRQIKALCRISGAQAQVVSPATRQVVGPLPSLDKLVAWMRENMPVDECAIMHGDYKFDNLVFRTSDDKDARYQVAGVLDWELSTLGHPLADLANLVMPFYVPQGRFPPPMSRVQEEDGMALADVMRRYCQATRRPYPVERWTFFIVFSFLRLAVIAQGIAARVARGQASSAQAEVYAGLFRPCMLTALEIAGIPAVESKL